MQSTSSPPISELLDALEAHAGRLGDPTAHFTISRSVNEWEVAVFTLPIDDPEVHIGTTDAGPYGYIEVLSNDLADALATAVSICKAVAA